MSVKVTGLQELIDLTEQLSDTKTLRKLEKEEMKEVGEKIKKDMKSEFPKSDQHGGLHGIDFIEVNAFVNEKGTVTLPVGVKDMMNSANFDITRGLWFTNFVTHSPNFGYYQRFCQTHNDKYTKELRDGIEEALENYIKSKTK